MPFSEKFNSFFEIKILEVVAPMTTATPIVNNMSSAPSRLFAGMETLVLGWGWVWLLIIFFIIPLIAVVIVTQNRCMPVTQTSLQGCCY